MAIFTNFIYSETFCSAFNIPLQTIYTKSTFEINFLRFPAITVPVPMLRYSDINGIHIITCPLTSSLQCKQNGSYIVHVHHKNITINTVNTLITIPEIVRVDETPLRS